MHLNSHIQREIRARNPWCCLFAGSWLSGTNLLGVMTAKAIGSQAVFWSEGHFHSTRYRGIVDGVRRAALEMYDAFAVPNQRSEAWIRSFVKNERPILRLPNTVQEDFFFYPDQDARNRARRELQISRDARILVQVSQLHAKKGVIPLARAFANQAAPDQILAFVGDGPLRQELASIANSLPSLSGRIILTGFACPDTVRQWLWAADGFALNSHIDPNPLAAIEAAFASLPLIISSKVGNVAEVLGDRNGWRIADPDNPGDAIREFLQSDLMEIRRMGVRSLQNAHHHFARARSVTRFLDDIFSLCGHQTVSDFNASTKVFSQRAGE